MKRLLIGIMLVAFAACSGQRPKKDVATVAAKADTVEVTAIPMKAITAIEPHPRVDIYPQYPDGPNALIETLTLPILDKDEKQRRTIVNFYVEKDGALSAFKVVKSSGSDSLDKKALQAVRGLKGPWKPGKTDGKAVRVEFTVPVTFIPQSSTR